MKAGLQMEKRTISYQLTAQPEEEKSMRTGVFHVLSTIMICLIGTMALSGICISAGRAADGVTVNGVQITREKVQDIQKNYGIRIVNGDYWYDKLSGAWGYTGGPVMGQVYPFMDLGGPLKSNASNGNTGVFINGRELHILDVRALQQITVVIPGRYWCDAYGNMGFEGGPPLVNLYVLAQQAAIARGGNVKNEGILSSYDKTGVAVIGGEVLVK
jgi:hypothetical protein